MTTTTPPDEVVETVRRFFAEHEVASLRLPAGWFGRPYDNFHQLTEASAVGDQVEIQFDELQLLRLQAVRVAVEGRTLRIKIDEGSWHWTSYGASDRHDEQLDEGTVEFHAPFGR